MAVLKGQVAASGTTVTIKIANFDPATCTCCVEPSWSTTWNQDTTYTTVGGVKINWPSAAPALAVMKYTAVL